VVSNTNSNTAASHWLEHLHINLGEMAGDARRTAFALLNSPWQCPKEDIVRYVPEPLNHAIVLIRRSVLRHVFGKYALLSAGTAISNTMICAYTFQSDGTAVDLRINAIGALEAYIGIAKEDLVKDGLQWADLSGQAQASLLTLYAACDTAVHVMAGMFEKCDTDNRSPHYVIHPKFQPAHKVMWFSRYWARQSNLSDGQMALTVDNTLERTPGFERKAPIFQVWVDWVLDKYLCLNIKYIPELLRTKNGSAMDELRSRAELLSFLWLRSIENQRDLGQVAQTILTDLPLTTVPLARLESAGFSATEVNTLLVESQEQALGDQLLTQGRDLECVHIHSMNPKFAVQKYLQPFLRRIGSPIGEWFEKDYLLRYLRDKLDETRFWAWSGINDQEAKYDADIIIYDKAPGIFYFCQVKHRAEVLQPFLRDELNEFSRNKAFRHGINQLQTLRSQIDSPGVRSRLVSRAGKKLVGEEPLAERSRFLLIHTVENFDMCTSDGIVMYEWNTFRNLLQGLVMQIGEDISEELRYRTQNLDFADIEGVQAHLMNITGRMHKDMGKEQPTPAHLYDLLNRAELSMDYRTALWLNDWPILPTGSASLRAPLL
jgi:hypothetical protein